MAETSPSNRLVIHVQELEPDERRDIIDKCVEFVESDTPFNTNHSTPSSPTQTFYELRPVVLPNEIVLHIFQYLDEPYKLRINVVHLPLRLGRRPKMYFNKPRLWASMPTFQICSATRSQAIKRYGQPSRYSLPFDGSVDILSFQIENLTYMHSSKRASGLSQIIADLRGRVQSLELDAGLDRVFSTTPLQRYVERVLSKFRLLHTFKLKLRRRNYYRHYHERRYMFPIAPTVETCLRRLPFFDSLDVFEIEKPRAQLKMKKKKMFLKLRSPVEDEDDDEDEVEDED